MGKGWGPSAAGAGYTGRNCHSTALDSYGWPLAGQPNAACRAPSFACELRWTLEMVVAVEMVGVHLRPGAAGPASALVPALACNTSQWTIY